MNKPGSQRPDQGQRLKEVIDQGAGADKIAFPDPAAAALGTDDEAAGQTPTAGISSPGIRTPSGEAEFRNPAGEVKAAAAQRLFFLLGLGVLAGALLVIVLALAG